MERSKSRNLVLFCGMDSTTRAAGRGRVGACCSRRAGRAALPRNRRGTVTVAEKAGRASCLCGTPGVPMAGVFSESRSVRLSLRGPDVQPSAKKERGRPAGRARGLFLSPGRHGAGFSIRAPRRQFLIPRTKQRRVFSPQSRDQLLSSRAGCFPVFPGGGVLPIPDNGTAPGFFNRGRGPLLSHPARNWIRSGRSRIIPGGTKSWPIPGGGFRLSIPAGRGRGRRHPSDHSRAR